MPSEYTDEIENSSYTRRAFSMGRKSKYSAEEKRKQSITIRLGAVDQSPYTENIRFSTGGFLYGREA